MIGRRAKPRLMAALLVALATASLPPPAGRAATPVATPTHDHALETAVDAYLKPLIGLDLFQGVVLIARGEKVALEKGYGWANVELGVRNRPAQVFRIASLSKPLTEVALGRLVEEKKLALSDPLSRFIPQFPRGDSITLEMLRTHRAGIASLNSIPYDEEASQPNTLDSLVRRIAREPLAFAPGAKRRYSNGGYALLGFVIEKASGQRYADYMERAVLRPLGMESTRHEADQMLVRGRAYGYTVSPDQRGALVVAPFQQMATKTGGGSLVSTARDLHRFLRAMYGDNAIRAATWKTLFPPDSTVAFQGRCPGFNLYMARDFTHDVDVVVLCNNYAAGMVSDVGDAFLALARGATVEPPPWRSDVRLDSLKAIAFTGTYRPPSGALPYGDEPVSLRRHDGGLVMYLTGTPVDVLIPQGGDAFLLRTLWSEMRFTTVDGAVKPTLRPLWFKTDPVPLERVADATPGR
jgi:CubicO group peptidase (beta-lactamase class C family)